MRYLVRFLVFITSVFFPTVMFAALAGNVLKGTPNQAEGIAGWAVAGAFLGLCFSGVFMNMVCGRLPREGS